MMVAMEHNGADHLRTASSVTSGLSRRGSLVIVARHHGVQLPVPQLVHDHLLEPGQPSVPKLLHIATASGLRASNTWLSWSELLKLDKALPAIVLLRNGNAMVVREVSE